MDKTQLFIAGIPGCGKSTFGRWLQTKKHFTYVDMENDGFDKNNLRSSWNSFYAGTDTKSFIAELRNNPSSIVLDWGFPPRCLPVVVRLKRSGIHMWWFDGDCLSTRLYFSRRATVPVEKFDSQYADISGHWAEIGPVFEPNIIKVIYTDGTRLSEESIFTRIFGQ